MSLLRKPIVVNKFREFHDYVKSNNGQIGIKQRGLDLNLNNACKGANGIDLVPLQAKESEINTLM